MQGRTIDNQVLIKNLKKGDFKAFDSLFYKYQKRLYAFIFGYLKSHADTEELVQDIFLKIWEKRKEIKEEHSFNSYLFTISKNTVFNFYRKKAYEQSYINELIKSNKPFTNKTSEDIEYSDLEKHAKDVIEKLPPKRKEVYKLSREKGLTYKEIAERLNISTKTVENHIGKALKFIREEMQANDFLSLLFIATFL